MNLSTAFLPQTDGQAERAIQILEDMLSACVIEFNGNWDDHTSLSSLTTIAIIRASKWPHMKIFIGGGADLLFGGQVLAKQG